MTFQLASTLFLSNQIRSLPQSLHHQFLTSSSLVDISDVIRRSLKVRRRIVALGDEDIIRGATFQRLVKWDGRTHKLLFDASETIETWLEFQVVV